MNSLLNVVLPLRQQLVKHQRSLQSFLLYFYKNHFSITIDFIYIEILRVLRLSKPCNTDLLNSFLLLEMLFLARVDQNLVIDPLLSFIVILYYQLICCYNLRIIVYIRDLVLKTVKKKGSHSASLQHQQHSVKGNLSLR